MKLLLTSAGLSNKSIVDALTQLTEKKLEETTIIFIPTASNAETGDKGWLIDDLIKLKKQNFKSIEITDISATEEKIWKPSLERADILYFEGGSTSHLLKWIYKTKLDFFLKELLKTKVFVGVSAGSMIATLNYLELKEKLLETNLSEEIVPSLKLVDFYILPHFNSDCFKQFEKENIKRIAKKIEKTIYVLDDNSAIKVVDDKIEVISEGEWLVFGEKK